MAVAVVCHIRCVTSDVSMCSLKRILRELISGARLGLILENSQHCVSIGPQRPPNVHKSGTTSSQFALLTRLANEWRCTALESRDRREIPNRESAAIGWCGPRSQPQPFSASLTLNKHASTMMSGCMRSIYIFLALPLMCVAQVRSSLFEI